MNGGVQQFSRVLSAAEREHVDRVRFGNQTHGNCRPVLGYPSKGKAAVAMREKGLSYKEIASLIGCSVTCARVHVSKHSGEAPRLPQRPTKNIMPTVRQSVAAALFDQAVEAGFHDLSARDIVRRLLHRIAERKLVEQLLCGTGR